MKLLVAVNPVSGGTDKTDQIDQIKKVCAQLAADLDLFILDGESDDERLRERIRARRPDRLVAMGGDGTIKHLAGIALEEGLPLGILPTGSANGMARELGIPNDLTEALTLVAGGRELAIDLIMVNGEICLHLSDIGLNAQLIKYYQQNNWRGMLGYARGVARVLVRKRALQVRVCTPAEAFQREAQMVALANARTYGTGAVINPEGSMTDGQFEVVLLRKFSWIEFLKMFWRFRPYDPTKTEVISATSIHLETKRRAYFQVDGEYRGRVKQIDAEIRPGALRLIVPEEGLPKNP